jgi:hypothetical protein
VGVLRLRFVLVAVVAFAGAKVTQNGFAASGSQMCATSSGQTACLNAWNGGPWVKVYAKRGTSHNDFTLGWDATLGVWDLVYTGGGPWNGQCVGDANNDSQNPEVSLDPCPSGKNSGGWGTHLIESPCNGGAGLEFYDVRWKGYLSPSLYGNGADGAVFILDSGLPAPCYSIYNPA